MSFISKVLTEDEKIKLQAELHWVNYLAPVALLMMSLLFVVGFVFAVGEEESVVFLLLGAVCLVPALYKYLEILTTVMIVTDKRVINKVGIISIKTDELKNGKIESVEVNQTIIGRILGYATIEFSGTGTSKVYFCNVAEPWKIKSQIETIIGD